MTAPGALVGGHDLPPAWDGHTVVWGGWESQPWSTWSFHAPRDRCTACGSQDDALVCRGRRDDHHALTAFRCPACSHDVVVDLSTGDVWDLDASDYGDAGSTYDPAAARAAAVARVRDQIRRPETTAPLF